jgi:hypothetical protein
VPTKEEYEVLKLAKELVDLTASKWRRMSSETRNMIFSVDSAQTFFGMMWKKNYLFDEVVQLRLTNAELLERLMEEKDEKNHP